jgi:hypothetical protein
MSRAELIAEINLKLEIFKVTRRAADYPTALIMRAMQSRQRSGLANQETKFRV